MMNLVELGSSNTFYDKVLGCWIGKNCGGTLGAPLEEPYGREEPFDVWWYPKIEAGGIPNDDLEMQLMLLKALEEIGPGLSTADLAEYWLRHVGYSFDEYGLSKANLQFGLLPPASGAYNNWFKDCMGSPIRSELWACVAPGHPNIAAHYAFQDAICDHAGGEGVYGELFNAAIQSAAFVLTETDLLLGIGLSYLPEGSATWKAIIAARDAFRAGHDWKTARKQVISAAPHYNAQYAPVNLGFQIIGWLYGNDFGDALCKAANCGYDTDCTAATVGGLLGILHGAAKLPGKWTEPLGPMIATSEYWGGMRHFSDGANPVPATLAELTARVCQAAQAVLAYHNAVPTLHPVEIKSLYAGEAVREYWDYSPMSVSYSFPCLNVRVDYGDTPGITADALKPVTIYLQNRSPDPLSLSGSLITPKGWPAPGDAFHWQLPPQGSQSFSLALRTPPAASIRTSNTLFLAIIPENRPVLPCLPLVFIGERKLRVSNCFDSTANVTQALDDYHEPERVQGSRQDPAARIAEWTTLYSAGNALELATFFSQPGIYYLQTFLFCPTEIADVRIGVDFNLPHKIWIDGHEAACQSQNRRIRPNTYDDAASAYTGILAEGWHEILVKVISSPNIEAFEGHIMVCTVGVLTNALPQIVGTHFPWDILT